MKQLFLIIALAIVTPFFAQDKGDKKNKKPKETEKFFYKDVVVETDDYKIYIVDAVAESKFSKFKMKVFNKTNDFLLIKPSEIIFSSGDISLKNTEKDFIIQPNDESSKVIDFKGTDLQLQKFNIKISGLYKVASKGNALTAKNFELPPSKNDFTVGNFDCVLKKYDATTSRSVAKFECTYKGDNIGIINPYKTSCVMPNKQENANAQKNNLAVLEKGKSDNFILLFNEIIGAGDLQKKSIEVKWNDAFMESSLSKLKDENTTFEQDLTREK